MPTDLNHEEVSLVLTTVPDILLAKRIAHVLIEEGLAACVSLGAPVLSMYRWDNDIQADEEIPLTIKTTTIRQAQVIARLVQLHPYDLPEAIVLPSIGGHTPYLQWVKDSTKAPTPNEASQ